MMGIKQRRFDPLPREISLEDLVPEGNFYRRLEATLDLSFVRDLVRPLYADGGRPSVDPVVFFDLQLVLFFEGIRSERELMRVAADRLSVRWYLGYDLNEPLPSHSSLTRARERFGVQMFRRFFEAIVEMCVEAGLVWGEELFFDSTKVRADADVDSLHSRVIVENHLKHLFGDAGEDVRKRVLDAIERIANAESDASDAPKRPEITPIDRYPLTVNEPDATRKVAGAFGSYFGTGRVEELSAPVPASEDFGSFGTEWHAPSVFWYIGGTDPDAYDKAREAGRVSKDIPTNHSPNFAPVVHPTLETGVEAMVVAARAWLSS